MEDCHRVSGLLLQLYRADPGSGGETLYRIADDIRQQPAGEGMQVAPLFPYESRFGFELFELTLLPGYQRESEPHEPGVTEHVIVISGVMEVLVDGQWRSLDQGKQFASPPIVPTVTAIWE